MSVVKQFFVKIVAQASNAAQAALGLGVGTTPTTPADGDLWNEAGGMYGRSNGVTFGLGASLGSFQDTIVAATAGQTTKVLTHTPANQTDIEVWLNGWPQDNANITALAGKTVTFTALALNDQVIFRYTRVD